MKKILIILVYSITAICAYAQQATEIDSKSVKLPRYATEAAVIAAIPAPTQGMLIYRNDTKSNWYFDGFAWKDMVVSSVSVPSPLYLISTSTTISGETNQADEAGVMGINTTDGVSFGVLGRASHIEPLDGGAGVKGENKSTNGLGFGVMGTHNGNGWAGYFEGYNALKTQGNTYLNGDVGIGTDSPWGKLAINTQGANHNVPSLLLTDDASSNEGGSILQFRNLADKRMYLQSHFGTQSDGTDSYLTFSHNATYNMRLRGDGNLGIGSLNPNLAGLVVNKKVGNSHAIFGDNTSGVSIESNFPGIHFNSYYNGSRKTIATGYAAGAEMNPTTGDFSIYTSPTSTTAGSTASVFERLKITKDGNIGINNNNPLNRLEVGGDINTTGLIKLNGISGNQGQVLTSNGAADPEWKNAAYANTTRFSINFVGDGYAIYHPTSIYRIIYNTNTSDVTIVNNSEQFTINKSGLYHFDFHCYAKGNTLTIPTDYPAFSLELIGNYTKKIFELKPMILQNNNSPFLYEFFENFSFDLYINAPQVFSLYKTITNTTGSPNVDINITANLISE